MNPPDDRLEEVLHAAYMIEYCISHFRPDHPDKIGAQLGQMDWVSELHRLIEGGELGKAERATSGG